MKLTVEGLVDAIQSARKLEALQAELRDALIQRLIDQSALVPENATLPGHPSNSCSSDSAITRTG